MTIEIRVLRKFSSRVSRARLARAARRAMRAEKADATLTIYVTGDAEIRALNRRFHATNAPTDVLSFPAMPAGVSPRRKVSLRAERSNPQPHPTLPLPRSDVERPYLGDVVISYERARVQARAAGWRIADELELLAVHGILHLLGYDDKSPRARKRMWKRQEEILGRVTGDR